MSKVSLLLRDDGINLHLKKTLESIYLQTYSNVEILLFCTSERKDKVEKILYKNFNFGCVYIFLDEDINLSLYAQTDKANGEFISCIMAGEELFPERIERQLTFLKKHKHYSLVGCWYFITNSNGKIIDVQKPHPYNITFTAQLIGSWETQETPVLLRKNDIPKIKKMSPLPYWFDTAGKTIGCLEEYLSSIPQYLQTKNLCPDNKKRLKEEWEKSRIEFIESCEDINIKRRLLKRVLLLFPYDKKILEQHKNQVSKEEKTDEDTLFLNHLISLNSTRKLDKCWNEIYYHYQKKGKNNISLLCGIMSLMEKPNIRLSKQSGVPVSVIIPTFNRGKVIGETLESLLNQELEDFEVIIINDGGAHEVENIIKKVNDKRFKYYWIPHVGRAGALNFGIEKAKGKYFSYIDDDDIFYPFHLSTLYKGILKNNRSFAYTKNYSVNGYRKDGKFYALTRTEHKGSPFDLKKLYANPIFGRLNVMHNRSMTEKLGGFDEELQWCIDWDLWLLYCRKTSPLFIDKFTSEHRRTTINIGIRNVAEEEFYTKKLMRPFFLSGYGSAIIAAAALVNGQEIDPHILQQKDIYIDSSFRHCLV